MVCNKLLCIICDAFGVHPVFAILNYFIKSIVKINC